MLKNYLISLYRNMFRNKFYTFLNIFGLFIGITGSLFVFLYVSDELGYDKHQPEHDRIYRLESEFIVKSSPTRFATAPIPLGPALSDEIPDIDAMVRLDPYREALFRYEEFEYFETGFYFADSTMFDIFTYNFIYGKPDGALTEPFSIVLSRSTTQKYFPGINPVGKILENNQGEAFKVTAVIEDQPGNTHLKFDALISVSTRSKTYSITKPSRFWRVGVFTFILLNENSNIEMFHVKFLNFYRNNMEELGNRFGVSYNLLTTPLAQTHFRSGLSADLPTGSRSYIFIFSAIAVFILLIASINYMNIATARSVSRAREVGLRKVLGADKKQLIQQFLGESVLQTIIATLFALICVAILLKDFNELTGKNIQLSMMNDWPFLFIVALVTLIIGIISGSYPAFYLASFQPFGILKGFASKSGKGSLRFRRILVVIQFFIAVFMIISTMVVAGQLHYLRTKDLGFVKDDVLLIRIMDDSFRQKIQSFKEELITHPGVMSVTNTSVVPGGGYLTQNMKVEQDEGMDDRALIVAQTDYDFSKTLNIEFIKGRDFDKNMGTDNEQAVIINEAAANELNWLPRPLGKKIHFGFNQQGEGGRLMKVVGVVRNFHFTSLHNQVEPFMFFIQENPSSYLLIKIAPGDQQATISFIQSKWENFKSEYPFKYEYLSNTLGNLYSGEQRISRIISISSILAVFIALLGLLGLSSFIAQQKFKEIGIRKIHGATVSGIVILLYRDFAVLFLLAFILAVPVAWWQLYEWLESNFVHHITLDWTYFLIAGILTFIVGLSTIGFHIFRASLKNPVETIKYE